MTSSEQLASLVAERRTIKPQAYNGKTIADSTVKQILASANWAPTHGYTEPWRFVVYSGNSLKTLGEFLANRDQPNQKAEDFNETRYKRLQQMPQKASHVIGIAMRRGDNPNIPEVEEVCSVAMAVQNMWLTAHSLDVASYWSTGSRAYDDDLRDFFGFDERHNAMGFFYLGLTDAEPIPGRRLSGIEDKVDWK
jgi:nitroreductase